MIKLKHSNSKRGVALVVTIGMLAILILAAIAFSISMRVERLAARNFADVVQARQWAQSALTLAMADIETKIPANQPMLPDSFGRVILSSGGGLTVTPRLYSQSATNYIPTSLTADADKNIQWKDQSENGKVVARYAYQIIDCSGFIDANFGGLTNVPSVRGVATNAMNIWLDQAVLSEMVAGRESDLKRGLNFGGMTGTGGNKSPWYEFTTLADLWHVAGDPAVGATHGARIFASRPANFFTYSRFLPGYANPATLAFVANPSSLGYSQTEWDTTKKTEIINKLLAEFRSFPGIPDPDTLAYNVYDYSDSNLAPESPNVRDGFAMESTPLVNEVLLDVTTRTAGSGLYRLEWTPHVELWYPFVGYTNTKGYDCLVRAEFGGDPNYVVSVSSASVTLVPPLGEWRPDTYKTHDYVFIQQSTPANVPPDPTKLYVDLSVTLRETPGTTLVDFVYRRRVFLSKFNPVVDAPNTVGLMINDPRFNSVTYNQWKETGTAVASAVGPTTMGGYNTNVLTHTAGGADFVGATNSPWIFWPNRAMQTVGEFGMHAYDPTKPWTTFPLLGPTAALYPFYDRFIINSNIHGRININTWRREVLQTAFNKAPVSGYPGQVSMPPCTAAQASNIADQIISKTTTARLKNMSEISTLGLPDVLAGFNRLESEGIIRDTAEILGVRQNIFTILVAAQSLSDSVNVLGEQRALAVVWRDPYADSTGHHPSFVRFFRWLND